MDEELDYKKMLLVPGIIMVVLIVAVIVMNVLIDNKAKNNNSGGNNEKTTTTTEDVGKPDIYKADIIIKEGLYKYSNSELDGISFFLERNKEDITMYYKNGNMIYKPVTSKQEFIEAGDKLVEYLEYELDDVNVYITAYDDGEIEYSDSDDFTNYILVEEKAFKYEGVYKNDDYTLVLYSGVYTDPLGADNGHIAFEYFCFVIDGDNIYLVDLDTKHYEYDDSAAFIDSNAVLFGKTGVGDYKFSLYITKNTSSYSVKFESDLYNIVAEEQYKYSRFNGDYKKVN